VERIGRARATAIVVAFVGCAVAVVVAAAASSVGSSDGRVTLPAFGPLVTAAFVAVVLLGLVMVLASVRHSDRRTVRRREHRPLSGLILVAAAVVVLLLLRPERDPQDEPVPTTTSTVAAPQDTTTSGNERDARGQTLVLVAVLASGALLAFLAARRFGPALVADDIDHVPPVASTDTLGDVVDDAIAALRAERDPRRAVIAAYARMEQALAHHGLPRRPTEAPLEYLTRALRRLDAGRAAVARLTDLFGWAMFSTHACEQAMQDEAIDALVAVRDDLRTAAAPR
jgi:hypothetical protein